MSHLNTIHWPEPDELSPEDLAEIGLNPDELDRAQELAEHPELENYYLAHAREPVMRFR